MFQPMFVSFIIWGEGFGELQYLTSFTKCHMNWLVGFDPNLHQTMWY